MNMKKNITPKTNLGKWSVGLNAFFLVVVIISIFLVKVLGVLSFDDHWWDVTVPVAALATIVAFVFAIISLIRNKDRSSLVYASFYVSLGAILFIIFHSLFITD